MTISPVGFRSESVEPNWRLLFVATVASALLALPIASPLTALYWYIFPLFGLGVAYVVQFRSESSSRWMVVAAATAVISSVALALDWPFSGHVLWNLLFIGHAWMTGKRRTTWMLLMIASLLYLFAMKLAFQTTRDMEGAVVAVGVAVVALVVLRHGDAVGESHT